jgi:UDP-glucose 4-epimerase
MVVPKLVGQAPAGRPLTVFGDGSQTRCFCHVQDVVRALVDLMQLGDEAYGEVFNIESREEISILSLAERVRTAYEEGFEDMPRRLPDIGKVEAAIGWTPTRSLDAILGDVIAFHQAEAVVV